MRRKGCKDDDCCEDMENQKMQMENQKTELGKKVKAGKMQIVGQFPIFAKSFLRFVVPESQKLIFPNYARE